MSYKLADAVCSTVEAGDGLQPDWQQRGSEPGKAALLPRCGQHRARFAPRLYVNAVYPPLRVFSISSGHTCAPTGAYAEATGAQGAAAQLTSALINHPQVKAEKIRIALTCVRRDLQKRSSCFC